MKLYLDTSVFSAYYDERTPERMQMTRDFWRVLERHEKLCSDLTIEELGQARSGLREKLLGLAQGFTVINLTDEMRELAKLYVKEGLVPSKYFADALHIAPAVLGGADILVSWNFKHLVKRSTRLLVNYINANQGLRTIEILAPPEV